MNPSRIPRNPGCQPKISTADAISHEFRTPLAVMLQCASLLRDEAAAQGRWEQVRLIDMILDRGDDLDALIDQWLASRGPTGGRWHPQPTPLEDLISPLRPLLERKSSLRGRTLVFDLQVPDEVMLYCDAERTRRTILQLASFLLRRPGDEGPILLTVALDQASESLRLSLGPDHALPPTQRGPACRLGLAWKRLLDGQPTWGLQLIERGLATQFGKLHVGEFPDVSLTVTLPLARPIALVHHHLAQWQPRRKKRPLTLLRVRARELTPPQASAIATLLDSALRRREWSLAITQEEWLVMLERSPERVESFRRRIDKWLRATTRRLQGTPATPLEWNCLGSLLPGTSAEDFVKSLESPEPSDLAPLALAHPSDLSASPITPLTWQP